MGLDLFGGLKRLKAIKPTLKCTNSCGPVALHVLTGAKYSKCKSYCKSKGGYKYRKSGTWSMCYDTFVENEGMKSYNCNNYNGKGLSTIMMLGRPALLCYYDANNEDGGGHAVVWNGWRLLDINNPKERCAFNGVRFYKEYNCVAVSYVVDTPFWQRAINSFITFLTIPLG